MLFTITLNLPREVIRATAHADLDAQIRAIVYRGLGVIGANKLDSEENGLTVAGTEGARVGGANAA